MNRVLPVIFLFLLGVSASAAATDNPYLAEGEAEARIEARLVAASGEEEGAMRRSSAATSISRPVPRPATGRPMR